MKEMLSQYTAFCDMEMSPVAKNTHRLRRRGRQQESLMLSIQLRLGKGELFIGYFFITGERREAR